MVHAAAAAAQRSPAPSRSLDEYRRVNVDATLTLAMLAAAAGVRRFVFVSSTAAMGAPEAAVVDETTPCRPTSPYEVTKRLAEEGLLELGARTGLEVVIVRPCLIAGEGQRGGVLLKMFQLCRKGLFPVFGGRLDVHKPLVDVEDVAHALILAATQGRPSEIYLVTSGVRHTLGEMLAIAGSLTGKPRPYRACPCRWRAWRPWSPHRWPVWPAASRRCRPSASTCSWPTGRSTSARRAASWATARISATCARCWRGPMPGTG